jgi:hypothetical protein
MDPRFILLSASKVISDTLYKVFDTIHNLQFWILESEIGYVIDSMLKEFLTKINILKNNRVDRIN